MAAVRIGVIGVGFGATVHIPAFQSEGLEVVAVCAQHQERAEEAARRFGIPHAYTDYSELIDQAGLDAVSVATMPGLHYEMALAALDAGKHVLCEKPFTVHAGQAEGLVAKAETSGLAAMMAHEFRFAPQRAYTKHLIDGGYIGEPRHLSATLFMSFPQRPGGPRPPSAGSSGMLGALGSHYIDCMRDWFGDISSVAGRLFGAPPEGFTLADANNGFHFDAEFANGAWGAMACSFASPMGPGARWEIYGSEGSLHLAQSGPNPAPDGIVLGGRMGESDRLEELPVPREFHEFDDDRDDRMMPFRILVRRFVHAIETGESPAPNFYDGLQCQRAMDAIQESAITGSRMGVATS